MEAMYEDDPGDGGKSALGAGVQGKSLLIDSAVHLSVRPSAAHVQLGASPTSPICSPIPGDRADFGHLMWPPRAKPSSSRSGSTGGGGRSSSDGGVKVQEDTDLDGAIKASVPRKPLDRAALETVRRAAMASIPHARPPVRLPAPALKEHQDERASAASAWLAAERRKAQAAKQLADERIDRVRQVAENARQKLHASKPARSVTINILPPALVGRPPQAPSSSSRHSSSASLPGTSAPRSRGGEKDRNHNTADDAEPRVRGSHPAVPRLSAAYVLHSFGGGEQAEGVSEGSIVPSPGVAIVPRRREQDRNRDPDASFERPSAAPSKRERGQDLPLPSPGVEVKPRVGYDTSVDIDMSAFNASAFLHNGSSFLSQASDSAEIAVPPQAPPPARESTKRLAAVAEGGAEEGGVDAAPTPRTKLSQREAEAKQQRRIVGKQFADERRAQLSAERRARLLDQQALKQRKRAALAALAARSRTYAAQAPDPAALRRLVYVRESAQMASETQVGDDEVPSGSLQVATASALNWSLAGDESNVEGGDELPVAATAEMQARLSRGLPPLPPTSGGASGSIRRMGGAAAVKPATARPPTSKATVKTGAVAGGLRPARSASATPRPRPTGTAAAGKVGSSSSSSRSVKPKTPRPVSGASSSKPRIAAARSASAPPRTRVPAPQPTTAVKTPGSANKALRPTPSKPVAVGRLSSATTTASTALSSGSSRPRGAKEGVTMLQALSFDMDITDLLNATVLDERAEVPDGRSRGLARPQSAGATDSRGGRPGKAGRPEAADKGRALIAGRGGVAVERAATARSTSGGDRLVSPTTAGSGRPVSAASRRYGSLSGALASVDGALLPPSVDEHHEAPPDQHPTVEALSRTMRGLASELSVKTAPTAAIDDGPDSLQALRRSLQYRLAEGIDERTNAAAIPAPSSALAAPTARPSAAQLTQGPQSPSKQPLRRVSTEVSLMEQFGQSFGGVGRPTFKEMAALSAAVEGGDEADEEEAEEAPAGQGRDVSLSFENPFDVSEEGLDANNASAERLRFGPGTPEEGGDAAEEILEEIDEIDEMDEFEQEDDEEDEEGGRARSASANNSSSSRAEQDDSVLLTASVELGKDDDDTDIEVTRGDREDFPGLRRDVHFTLSPGDNLDVYSSQEREEQNEQREAEEERQREGEYRRILDQQRASAQQMRKMDSADVTAFTGLVDDRNDVVAAFTQGMSLGLSHSTHAQPDGSIHIAHRPESIALDASSPTQPTSLPHTPLSTTSALSAAEASTLDPLDRARLAIIAKAKKKAQLEIEIKTQRRLSSHSGSSLRNVGSLAGMLRSSVVVFDDAGEEEVYRDAPFSFEEVEEENDENETNLINIFATRLLMEQNRLEEERLVVEKERLAADAAKEAVRRELNQKAKEAREAAGISDVPGYMSPRSGSRRSTSPASQSPGRRGSPSRSPTGRPTSPPSLGTSSARRLSPPGRAAALVANTTKASTSPSVRALSSRKAPTPTVSRVAGSAGGQASRGLSGQAALEQAKLLRLGLVQPREERAAPRDPPEGDYRMLLSKSPPRNAPLAPAAAPSALDETPSFWDELLARDPYNAPRHSLHSSEPPPMSAADWEAVRVLAEGVMGVGSTATTASAAGATASTASSAVPPEVPRQSPSEMATRMHAALQQHDTLHALSLELSQLEQQRALSEAQAAVQAITNVAEKEQAEFRVRQELSLQQQAYELSLASAVSSVQLSMQAAEGQHQHTLAQLVARIHEQEITLRQMEAGGGMGLRTSAGNAGLGVGPAATAAQAGLTAATRSRSRSPRAARPEDDDESLYSATFEDDSAAESPRARGGARSQAPARPSRLDTASVHSVEDEDSVADVRSLGNQSVRSVSTTRSGQAAYRSDNDESIADEVGAVEASPAARRLARAGGGGGVVNNANNNNKRGHDSDYSEVFDDLSFSEQGTSRMSDSGMDSSDFDRGYERPGAPGTLKRGNLKPFTSPTRPQRAGDRDRDRDRSALSHSGSLSAVHFKDPETTESPKRRGSKGATRGGSRGTVALSTSALPARHPVALPAPSRSLDSALPRPSLAAAAGTASASDAGAGVGVGVGVGVGEYRAEIEARLRSMERGLALRLGLATSKRDHALGVISAARTAAQERRAQLGQQRSKSDAPLAPEEQAVQARRRSRLDKELASLQQEEEMAEETYMAEMAALEKEKWGVSARAYRELRKFHAMAREMEQIQDQTQDRGGRDAAEGGRRGGRGCRDASGESESDSRASLSDDEASPRPSRTATAESAVSVSSGASSVASAPPVASRSTPTPLESSVVDLADSTDTIADLERSINLRQQRIAEIRDNITSIAEQQARLDKVRLKQREREALVVMEDRLLRRAQALQLGPRPTPSAPPGEMDAEVRAKIREIASKLVAPLYIDEDLVMGLGLEGADAKAAASAAAATVSGLELDDSFGSDADLEMADPLQAAGALGALPAIQARAKTMAALAAAHVEGQGRSAAHTDLAEEHALVAAMEEDEDSFGSDAPERGGGGGKASRAAERDSVQERELAALELSVRRLRAAVRHSQQLQQADARAQQEAADVAALTGLSPALLQGPSSGAAVKTMAYTAGLREAEAMLEAERARVAHQQARLATERVVRAAEATLGTAADQSSTPAAPVSAPVSAPAVAVASPAPTAPTAPEPTASPAATPPPAPAPVPVAAPSPQSSLPPQTPDKPETSRPATPDSSTRAALVVGRIDSILGKKGRPSSGSLYGATPSPSTSGSGRTPAASPTAPLSRPSASPGSVPSTPTQALAAAVAETLRSGAGAAVTEEASIEEEEEEEEEEAKAEEEEVEEVEDEEEEEEDEWGPVRPVDPAHSADFSVEGSELSLDSAAESSASSAGLYASPTKLPRAASSPATAAPPLALDTAITPFRLSPDPAQQHAQQHAPTPPPSAPSAPSAQAVSPISLAPPSPEARDPGPAFSTHVPEPRSPPGAVTPPKSRLYDLSDSDLSLGEAARDVLEMDSSAAEGAEGGGQGLAPGGEEIGEEAGSSLLDAADGESRLDASAAEYPAASVQSEAADLSEAADISEAAEPDALAAAASAASPAKQPLEASVHEEERGAEKSEAEEAEELEEEIAEELESFDEEEEEVPPAPLSIVTTSDAAHRASSPATPSSPSSPSAESPSSPHAPSPSSPAKLVLAASLAQSPRPALSPKSPKAVSADLGASFSPSPGHASALASPFEAAAALPLSPGREGSPGRDGEPTEQSPISTRSPVSPGPLAISPAFLSSPSPPGSQLGPGLSPTGSPVGRSPQRDREPLGDQASASLSPRESLLAGDVFEEIDSPSSPPRQGLPPLGLSAGASIYEQDDEDDLYAFDLPKAASASASTSTAATGSSKSSMSLVNPNVAPAAVAAAEPFPPSPVPINWAGLGVDIVRGICEGVDLAAVASRLGDRAAIGPPLLSLPNAPLPPSLAPHAPAVLDRLNDVLSSFHALRHNLPLPAATGASGTGVSLASLGLGATDLSRRMLAREMALSGEAVQALLLHSLQTLGAAQASVGAQKKHFLELVECSTVEDVQQELQGAVAAQVDGIVEALLASLLRDEIRGSL